jgi:hypothetical protein
MAGKPQRRGPRPLQDVAASMSLSLAPPRYSLSLATFLLLSIPLFAQAPAQALTPLSATAQDEEQASAPAPITMEQEHHHHLVFENAYIKAFYVEIPAHDATLYHRHDLPYISLPPPPLSGGPAAREGAPAPRTGPRVGYMAGGFSHAVSNTRDVPLRNVAIELVRPQGTVRNRCAQIVRDQPLGECDRPTAGDSSHYALFDTNEITVEYWDLRPGATIRPADARLGRLVGDLSGIINVIARGDSRIVPQAGLVWLLAGSKTAFEAGADSDGHFVTITFKDSALKP